MTATADRAPVAAADLARQAAGWSRLGWPRRHAGILTVLVAGTALRVLAMIAYRPALRFPDSARYLTVAGSLRPDTVRPLVYSLLLRALRPTETVASVAVVQHLLGLGVAVGIYAFLLSRGAPRWLAVLAAAPIALDAYEVLIEQYVLAETLFLGLLCLCLWLLARRERPGYRALTLAGLLLALAALTRTAGAPLILALAGYLVLRRAGWLRIGVLLVAFAVPMAGYAAAYQQLHGQFSTGGDPGRFLYGRVAPFADCSRVPNLTGAERQLCQATPPAQRSTGSEWYDWSRDSPAARFHGPASKPVLGSFATKVIRAQPFDFAAEVARDSLHYFRPGRPVRPQDSCQDFWIFHTSQPTTMPLCSTGAVKVGWLGVLTFGFHGQRTTHHLDPGTAGVLRRYQTLGYTPGPLLALCLILSAVAVLRRRRLSAAGRLLVDQSALLAAVSVLLVVVPSATAVFDYRYGLQLIALLPVAGALALTASRPRDREHRLAERRTTAGLQTSGAGHDDTVPDP